MEDRGEHGLRPCELLRERHDDVLVRLSLGHRLDVLVLVGGIYLERLVRAVVRLPRRLERGPVDRRAVIPCGLLVDLHRDDGLAVLCADVPFVEVRRVGLDRAIRVDEEDLGRVPRGKASGVSRRIAVEQVHLRSDLIDAEPDGAALLEVLPRLRIVVRLLDLGGCGRAAAVA
ncbi:hypothetical protein ABE10_03260, partial [Bacillus toyonensis]|nr:hypothetical protein [Bacillus toyonensis]